MFSRTLNIHKHFENYTENVMVKSETLNTFSKLWLLIHNYKIVQFNLIFFRWLL